MLVFARSSVKDWKLLILFICSVLAGGVNAPHPWTQSNLIENRYGGLGFTINKRDLNVIE